MTYTNTHALILNHNKHITVTDLRIFMYSYNTFTYIIILVTNLYLYRSLVYGTELVLRATYTYSELTLMADLFLFRSPVRVTELIPIRRYLYTYWYLYLSQISRRSSHNLCLYRGTLRYYKVYMYTIGLILILRCLHLFGGTSRYYRDYICITELILVLRNLFLYGSTCKYHLFNSPKRHILVLVSNVYVFRSPKGHIYQTYSYTCLGLIIIQISQRTST